MITNSKLIGKITDQYKHTLHQDLADRFAKATNAKVNADFNYAALAALGNFESAFKALGISSHDAMHARESLKVFSEPPFGKSIFVKTKIEDLFEQQASDRPLAFINIQVSGSHNGKAIFVLNRIFALSGGFPRH